MTHEHTLHLDPRVRQEARNRLLSAKGHLEGILKMLEGEPYCVDVLKQIKAVQGALDKVGEMVLRSHPSTTWPAPLCGATPRGW